MYLVFYGCGNYKQFTDKNKALEFCKKNNITWIDC